MAGIPSLFRSIVRFLVILVMLGAVLYGVQLIWHPFDPIIAFVNQDVAAAGATLSNQIVAGVSLGALVLFVILMLVPLLLRGVDNKQFLGSFFRGILASVVFLATDWLYGELEHLGRIYLVVGIVASVVVTFFLIEIITRAGKSKHEVSTRTDLLASITSGLAFSLLLKIGTYAWEYAAKVLGSQ
ncbi:MAG: hypothetical protein WCG80_12775 [Spirochaetales bacterium]